MRFSDLGQIKVSVIQIFSLINLFCCRISLVYSFLSVSIIDIHGNFNRVIVRGAVAQQKSFRGNYLGGNCPGRNFIGVIVRGEVVQVGIIWGELSEGQCRMVSTKTVCRCGQTMFFTHYQ